MPSSDTSYDRRGISDELKMWLKQNLFPQKKRILPFRITGTEVEKDKHLGAHWKISTAVIYGKRPVPCVSL